MKNSDVFATNPFSNSQSTTTWVVKVPFENYHLYVMEGDSKFQLRVRTFETQEKAEKFATFYGEDCIVEKVTEYCKRCNYYPATKKSHVCPYSSEINQDETKCKCCESCEEQCALDI